jgi:preprotein translocase subunit SecD
MAGLILSVGMAVDANVLIFERIREELILGRATRTAVDEGFAHALSAIVDANITTLITALILFQFGTGPVRGFAVTLSIGIVASFFSALYVTRTFFLMYLSGKKASDPISI